ncbi:MAG: PRC-barrel domain protein [Myxococcaceae bacterium]|nr:PRC-barrel domain protein [Myxococcaceae bacterium]
MKTTMMAAVILLVAAAPSYAQPLPQVPASVGDHALGVPTENLDGLATGHRASKLINAPLYNDQGQKVGKIGDLVVTADGKVTAAIVDVGGFLGVGKRQVAIALQRIVSVKDKLTLSGATKENLQKLPEFQYNKPTVAPI